MFSLPILPQKRRLIICYNKSKNSNLIISNNTSLSTELLDTTNIVYMFKCALRDCVSKENNTYVGFTTTILSRRLTVNLNDSIQFPNPNSEKFYMKTPL